MRTCPSCHHDASEDLAADGSGDQPEAGDLSVCWYCADIAIFRRSPLGILTLAAPTAAELDEARDDPEVRAALAARERAKHDVALAAALGDADSPLARTYAEQMARDWFTAAAAHDHRDPYEMAMRLIPPTTDPRAGYTRLIGMIFVGAAACAVELTEKWTAATPEQFYGLRIEELCEDGEPPANALAGARLVVAAANQDWAMVTDLIAAHIPADSTDIARAGVLMELLQLYVALRRRHQAATSSPAPPPGATS